MRLQGWNEIPDGYGAWFDLNRAPLWLRLWFRTPFLDRFAYPVVVRRGFGHLTAHPGWSPDQLGEIGPGWRTDPDGRARRPSSRRTSQLLIRGRCDGCADVTPELCGGIALSAG